jgi:hypothetical protein
MAHYRRTKRGKILDFGLLDFGPIGEQNRQIEGLEKERLEWWAEEQIGKERLN